MGLAEPAKISWCKYMAVSKSRNVIAAKVSCFMVVPTLHVRFVVIKKHLKDL